MALLKDVLVLGEQVTAGYHRISFISYDNNTGVTNVYMDSYVDEKAVKKRAPVLAQNVYGWASTDIELDWDKNLMTQAYERLKKNDEWKDAKDG